MIVKYRNDPELIKEEQPAHAKPGDTKIVTSEAESKITFTEVLNEVGLKNLVESKTKDFNFKSLEYIQSCVKHPIGTGTLMLINFFAPLNEKSPATAADEINYIQYKSMPDELSLLQNE